VLAHPRRIGEWGHYNRCRNIHIMYLFTYYRKISKYMRKAWSEWTDDAMQEAARAIREKNSSTLRAAEAFSVFRGDFNVMNWTTAWRNVEARLRILVTRRNVLLTESENNEKIYFILFQTRVAWDESTIIVACTNGIGNFTPPIVIFKGKIF